MGSGEPDRAVRPPPARRRRPLYPPPAAPRRPTRRNQKGKEAAVQPARPPRPARKGRREKGKKRQEGKAGRDYGGPGFVTTPIETLFRIEDRIVFEAQIPNNMKIYKAEHNNKGPKTQEEFMQVIIKDGGITLPELYQGDVYWYNPKTEELLVRHPKQGKGRRMKDEG